MKRMWSKEELTEETAGGPVETLDASKFSLADDPLANVTASNAYKIGNMGIATIKSVTSVNTGGPLVYSGKVLYGTKIGSLSSNGRIIFSANTSSPYVVIFEIF